MVRKFLLAFSCFGMVGASQAADLPYYPEEPVFDVFSWQGFYLGAHIGFPSTDVFHHYTQGLGSEDTDYPADGLIGGIHAGYNFQAGAVVFGIEGDIEVSEQDGVASNAFFTSSAEIDWMASLRGRLGYVFNTRAMVYVTGGVTFTDMELGFATPIGAMILNSDTATGWTAGLGLEYALTDHWMLRAEYRYTDTGDGDVNFAPPFPDIFDSAYFEMHTARFGASYKF